MGSPLNPYQDMANGLIAYYGRTNSFDIYRPDYDSSEKGLLYTNVDARLDGRNAKATVMNPLPGVIYLVLVTGYKASTLSGDLFVPSVDDQVTPTVTVIHNTEMSDCIAARTSKLCTIQKTERDPVLYTNVSFDFVSTSGPTSPVIPEFEESKEMETNRAVVYKRAGIVKGVRLIDAETQKRYLILATSGTGNHMLLQLKGDTR